MKQLLVIASVLLSTLSSCHGIFGGEHIHGDGNVVSESRSVSEFKGVDVSGGLVVIVKQDSITSVKVEIDKNLQEYIITEVKDGILEIYQENNTSLESTKGIKIYVNNPTFKSFEATGATEIKGEGKISGTEEIHLHVTGASKIDLDIKAPKVSGEISGASTLKLTGETKDFIVDANGASHAKCFDLMTENVEAELSGASSADVFASVKISGKASGASHLSYKGNASTSFNTSGAGSVKKEN
jgi:hypothetical protein